MTTCIRIQKNANYTTLKFTSFVVWQDPGWWISSIGPLWHPIVRYQMTTTRKQLFKYLPVVVGLLCLRCGPIKSLTSCSQCFIWNLKWNLNSVIARDSLPPHSLSSPYPQCALARAWTMTVSLRTHHHWRPLLASTESHLAEDLC